MFSQWTAHWWWVIYYIETDESSIQKDVLSDSDVPNNKDDWEEKHDVLPDDINEDLFDEFYNQAIDEVSKFSMDW